MSNYQQQAYLAMGGQYIGPQSPIQEYVRGIKLPLPEQRLSKFDQCVVWVAEKIL